MRTMHLFAGAGGGLLCDLILGHDPIIAVEWDPYCCAVLRERVVDGWFPNLHVWEGDIQLFDPSEYSARMDCIHAGFPCQDLSTAGHNRRIGEGTRSGLYREVLRIAGIVRPRYLFLENVSAILDNELLGTVLGDLAAIGYDARWTCLPASATGAPHYRDRWWCLAERSDSDSEREPQPQGSQQDQRGRFGDMGGDVADSASSGFHKRGCTEFKTGDKEANEGIQHESKRCGENVANSLRLSQQGDQQSASYAKELEKQGKGQTGHSCDGFGWWSTEPSICRVVDGMANRAHRIKALGNGQVPIQAALAWIMRGGPTG